jgi:plasmid stabilization system protein ParE
MTHRVTFTSKANRELSEAALWWAANRSTEQAARWLEEIQAAIATLAENPERYPLAREEDLFPFPLRQLLFSIGKRPTHRILYRVREDEVLIYGIRHVRQSDLTPNDL